MLFIYVPKGVAVYWLKKMEEKWSYMMTSSLITRHQFRELTGEAADRANEFGSAVVSVVGNYEADQITIC